MRPLQNISHNFFPIFFIIFENVTTWLIDKIIPSFSSYTKRLFDSTHKTFRYISDIHLYKGSIVLRNGSIWKNITKMTWEWGIYVRLRRLEYKCMYVNGISLSEYKGNTIFQANTLLCHSKTKFRSQSLTTVCFIWTLDLIRNDVYIKHM